MKTPWLSLATLAAADTGRILCVVPSRWPPSRSLEAVASTWLKDCDSVTIAVSARQFNASRGAAVARRKSARKFITRNVAVTHDGAGFTPWLPIRAADCEAGKPSEPCTKGCWGGGAFGFHGKPLKNHFLVTHFYRALGK